MRVQLSRQLPGRFELYEEWLVSARFEDRQEDAEFAGYLNRLFAAHPIDLVITLGAPAANFVQRYQQSLFRTTPELLTDVEERRASRSSLAPNEAAVAISVSFPLLVENILRVQPRTSTVAVVIGNSPVEKYWVGQIRDSLESFKKRVTLTFLNGLPFSDVLKRVRTLPAGSAILYILLSPDVEGIPQDEDTALAALHAVASAPIFSYSDVYLGKGIVGGPLIHGEEQGREAVTVAARLLSGERAADIKMPPITLSQPAFDWRELKRWNIRESDLPPGSTILFREPPAWERYRWQIIAVAVVLVLEAALIAALLHERRRRRNAEMNAHQHMAELAHMNRRAAVGELSASIAHELTQPLGAILRNSEAGQMMLKAASPDLSELANIMTDIGRDDQRASEVIKRVRNLLTKTPSETREVDINEVVLEVFEFLSPQARAHHVTLSTDLVSRPLLVSSDRVQLQQVILNLVMNGMEAIRSVPGGERKITGRTMLVDGASAEVAVEDSGPGIPPDKVQEIFEPFFTTKDTGMGMGLSIARTIVASHGGRIWAANRRDGGAVLRFTVPLARTGRSTVALQRAANQVDSTMTGSQFSGAFGAAQLKDAAS
ncbi:MAG: HAMP domain-containing histidine kinase [Gammaproteobacteria bacterium]|nr:HAMP domain-containing histidine kinase [Gammaproteobacteria bacterium]